MTSRYRYQFPIHIHCYKWGFNVWLQHPIVREHIPPPSPPGQGDISMILGIFDDDE